MDEQYSDVFAHPSFFLNITAEMEKRDIVNIVFLLLKKICRKIF
jgi:hypothetical protein